MTITALTKELGTTSSYMGSIIYGRRSGEKYLYDIAKTLDIDLKKHVS